MDNEIMCVNKLVLMQKLQPVDLRPCHTRQFVLANCNAICRLQLGCQTYAICFTTCNEIIFYAGRVFKNLSVILIMSYCDWFLLKKIARQVAVGVSHAASTFSAIFNANSRGTFTNESPEGLSQIVPKLEGIFNH